MNSRLSWVLLSLLAVSLCLNVYLYSHLALDKVLNDVLGLQQNQPGQPQTVAVEPKTANISRQTSDDQPTTILTAAGQANQQFNRFAFDQAVARYEELIQVDEQAAIEVKRHWYEQLKMWLKNKDFAAVNAFNAAFLQVFPYDLTFLGLKAEMLAATERSADAIELYYLLISYTFETRQEEFFQARARHLAGEQLSEYQQQRLWQAVIGLSQQLLQQEPDYPPYILAQAEAYIRIGEFDHARPQLTDLLDNRFYREQTEQLLSDIRKQQLQQTAVSLQPLGEHYIVAGQINQSENIRLMIDTGASVSVLTRARFEQLQSWTNPLYLGETLLNTAGGQVNAPIYQFERFEIDDFYVNDISFVILDLNDMASADYHGLLGMNFLKQFDFRIDQQNKQLILSP